METITMMIDRFGPWAVVCVCLAWLAKYLSDQVEKARKDRNASDIRHKEEVDTLTEVIQNNTLAITKLTDYISHERGENE